MDPVRIAVFGAAVPAVVAAVVFLLARKLRGGGAPVDVGLALAAGFVAGFVGLGGLPRFPILDKWHWLLPLAAGGGLIALLASRATQVPEALRWMLRAVLAAVGAAVTVRHPTVPWLAGAFAGVLVLMAAADRVARHDGAVWFLATTLVVVLASAVAIGVSNFATLAQVAGGLAAATGACLALACFLPAAARGAVALVGVVVGAALLDAYLYADLPATSLALLAAAMPAGAFLVPRDARLRPWIVLGIAAALSAAAVAIAVSSSEPLGY